MICPVCHADLSNLSKRDLSNHLKRHKYSTKDFTINVLLDGIVPSCPICGKEPRYSSFEFKEFCMNHANCGYSKGGKSEEEIAKENNLFRIFGCKNRIFLLSI